MYIISKRKLRDYWQHSAQAEIPLTEWYFRMKECHAQTLTQLRNIFNSVDPVYGYTVFNIGDNLELYDDEHHLPIGHNISEIDMVKYLMEENELYQKDLAFIFGSQANVSKFLTGERTLSKKQIAGLKKFFNISADFFIGL